MLLGEVISELEAVAKGLRGIADLMESAIERFIPLSGALIGRELQNEADNSIDVGPVERG